MNMSDDSLFRLKINQLANKPLTTKELEVLYHTLCGLKQRQTADVLKLSSRTIEDYINRIKVKLKCKHKSELFELAFQHGVLNIVSQRS